MVRTLLRGDDDRFEAESTAEYIARERSRAQSIVTLLRDPRQDDEASPSLRATPRFAGDCVALCERDPMRTTYAVVKRLLDVTVAVLALVVAAPVLVLISLLLLLKQGPPVIFRQHRLGRDGVPFAMLKFRTMITGAEKQGTGLDSFENDARVTPLGRFLRSWSLDELPQLFNILRGDMSFVGPRPPVTYHPFRYDEYPLPDRRRFQVRPGVTGLAQVNGRNALSWPEKIRFDLEYVDKMSFSLDLQIVLKTIFIVLSRVGEHDRPSQDEAQRRTGP